MQKIREQERDRGELDQGKKEEAYLCTLKGSRPDSPWARSRTFCRHVSLIYLYREDAWNVPVS